MVKCEKNNCFGNEKGNCKVLRAGFETDCPFFRDQEEVKRQHDNKAEGFVLENRLSQFEIQRIEKLKGKEQYEYEKRGIIRVNGGVQYVGIMKKDK